MNQPERPTGKRKEALLKLARMPPEKRARLLELEAKKRGLFLPKSDPVVSDMLTPAEIERLRQSALAANAYGRKAFAPRSAATGAAAPSSDLLTTAEIERLRQNALELRLNAFGRKAFPPKPQAKKAGTAAGTGMLTPSELEQLRQNGKEVIAYGRKAFPPKSKG